MDAMNEDMQSMANNKVWELVELPKNCKLIGNKWVLKQRKIQMAELNNLKLDLWSKVSLKENALTLMRSSHLYQLKTPLEMSWHL